MALIEMSTSLKATGNFSFRPPRDLNLAAEMTAQANVIALTWKHCSGRLLCGSSPLPGCPATPVNP